MSDTTITKDGDRRGAAAGQDVHKGASAPAQKWAMQALPEFTDDNFSLWRKLLEERTGIHLVPQQRAFLHAQLAIRLRELGNITLDEYRVRLQDGLDGVVEWSTLLDRLVVKETSFFRHVSAYEFLQQYVQSRICDGSIRESLDVWSVGCSTGEEPYSLAMMLDDCFQQSGTDNYWGVTGTDISAPALTTARNGVYYVRKLEMVNTEFRQRYFEKIDETKYRVINKLRDRVCFAHGNVIELKKMPVVKMDIVSTHNMLIYFRRWQRRKILNSLVERLKPGGILIIGLGEIIDWSHSLVERVPDESVQAYIRKA